MSKRVGEWRSGGKEDEKWEEEDETNNISIQSRYILNMNPMCGLVKNFCYSVSFVPYPTMLLMAVKLLLFVLNPNKELNHSQGPNQILPDCLNSFIATVFLHFCQKSIKCIL